MSLVIREPNDALHARYRVLAARYRGRGWDVPPMPTGGLAAMNLMQEMVARINGREPIRIQEGPVAVPRASRSES